ncbi:hypothetical protein CLCR_11070 [Cladophialophora carrionii]|uniref:Uncharacterized protein n=1 Tax=Cladophialophora carrionii TaxID=86049 RepID=A0A1C1CXX0_9EURO|nr:hypothetical protein CLCR_11070 [Cladophialophora carrionii]
MVKSAVVIPVAVLASICVVMFVFIWWWFPRHYRKGVADDMNIMDGERARRDATHAGLEGGTTDAENMEASRPKTLEEHIAIARANIRRGHNPAATPY